MPVTFDHSPNFPMLPHSTPHVREIYVITGLVFVVHLANAAVAAWAGYLSPDSWHYLRMAKSLYINGYPSVHGTSYYAAFPFGYPLLLALVSPGLDLAQTAVVSKFANGGLWISAYFALKSLRISPVLAAAVVMTPFSLSIAATTWSENLMLLALILTLLGIDRLQEGTSRSQAASIISLLAALLLGIASRYIFGFLLLGFATAYLISFSTKAFRPQIFLAFAASAGFFVLYLLVNVHQTGYATGGARIAVTESTSYLVFTFAKANYQLFLSMLLPVAALAFLTVRHWRLRPIAVMAALVGVAYIAILAYLRWHTQFDPFDQRLIGPGWFLLTVALVLAACTPEPDGIRPLGSIALLCLALWAGYSTHGETASDLLQRGEAWTSPTQALRKDAQTFHRQSQVTSVISVAVPSPRVSMDADPLYYGDLRVFTPGSAPFLRRETLAEFRERVLAGVTDIDHCVVDFSRLASRQQLSDVIDARYRTGLKHFDARFDSTIAGRFRKIFRARTLVPCSKFLEREASR